MANEVDYSPCQYRGNSSTREFSYDWKLMEVEELIVSLELVSTGDETILELGSDYTVLNEAVGGKVTLTTAPSEDYYINIRRKTSQYQKKGYSTSTGFQGDEIEKSFDKVSCNLQDMQHGINTFEEEFSDEVDEKIEALDYRVTSSTNTANTALSNSQTAISTSNTALSTADTAVTKSNTAISTANGAVTTANQADTKSDNAVSVANSATQTANTASATANAASAKVDEFGEDIEEVKEAAQKINELEESVATAVQAAGTATAQAQTATSEAGVATSKALEATQAAQTAIAQTTKIGDLDDLTTTEKNTVVGAINEVNAKDSLPSQSGQGGKYLTTDGTTASWATVSAPSALVDLTDVQISNLQNNDMIMYNSTNTKFKNFPTITTAPIIETYISGETGYVVYSNGYCIQWGYRASSGSVTLLKTMANSKYFRTTTVTAGTTTTLTANGYWLISGQTLGEELYAWSNYMEGTYYTTSLTPNVGDILYNSNKQHVNRYIYRVGDGYIEFGYTDSSEEPWDSQLNRDASKDIVDKYYILKQ